MIIIKGSAKYKAVIILNLAYQIASKYAMHTCIANIYTYIYLKNLPTCLLIIDKSNKHHLQEATERDPNAGEPLRTLETFHKRRGKRTCEARACPQNSKPFYYRVI